MSTFTDWIQSPDYFTSYYRANYANWAYASSETRWLKDGTVFNRNRGAQMWVEVINALNGTSKIFFNPEGGGTSPTNLCGVYAYYRGSFLLAGYPEDGESDMQGRTGITYCAPGQYAKKVNAPDMAQIAPSLGLDEFGVPLAISGPYFQDYDLRIVGARLRIQAVKATPGPDTIYVVALPPNRVSGVTWATGTQYAATDFPTDNPEVDRTEILPVLSVANSTQFEVPVGSPSSPYLIGQFTVNPTMGSLTTWPASGYVDVTSRIADLASGRLVFGFISLAQQQGDYVGPASGDVAGGPGSNTLQSFSVQLEYRLRPPLHRWEIDGVTRYPLRQRQRSDVSLVNQLSGRQLLPVAAAARQTRRWG